MEVINHPNGFRAWIIATRWFQLRLHHWPTEQIDPDIHEERSSFVSVVLWGQLEETRWRETDGDSHSVDHCRSLSTEQTSRKISLTQSQQFIRKAPAMYTLKHGVLHQVYAKPGTWTFSIRGPTRLPYSRVYRPRLR